MITFVCYLNELDEMIFSITSLCLLKHSHSAMQQSLYSAGFALGGRYGAFDGYWVRIYPSVASSLISSGGSFFLSSSVLLPSASFFSWPPNPTALRALPASALTFPDTLLAAVPAAVVTPATALLA